MFPLFKRKRNTGKKIQCVVPPSFPLSFHSVTLVYRTSFFPQNYSKLFFLHGKIEMTVFCEEITIEADYHFLKTKNVRYNILRFQDSE